jgi:hypothetical protein
MPCRFIIAIGVALLPITVAGCANQEAFAAADYAKCQQLGFTPGTQHHEMCLSEVQQQRTGGIARPEPLRDQTSAVPQSGAYR